MARNALLSLRRRLWRQLRQTLQQKQQTLTWLGKRLRDPRKQLQRYTQQWINC